MNTARPPQPAPQRAPESAPGPAPESAAQCAAGWAGGGEPQRAARLETLLGDPLDPANPHSHHALLEADERREVPQATEHLLTQQHLGAEFVPHDLGGRLRAPEELARVLRPVFRRDVALGFGFGITSLFAASAVWTAGTGAQRAELARLLLAGGRAAILHRELAHANALLREEFTALPAPGGYVLGGRKEVVMNADRAHMFVMYARTSTQPGGRSHSVLLLDPRTLPPDRLHRLERTSTTGMRSGRFSAIAFTDCPAPHHTLVGQAGDGVLLALRTFQVNRCLIPATVIAGVDTVLRHAVSAATEHRAGALPARRWQRVLAGVFADLLACDSMALAGLRALNLLPDSAHLLAAAVKYTMPDLLREDLEELATALGARGYERGPLSGGFRKLIRDLPVAGLGHAGTAACQAVLVPHLRTLARTSWQHADGAEVPAALFTPGAPLPPFDYRKLTVTGAHDPLTAALPALADHLHQQRTQGPIWAALAELAATFVLELRALGEECAQLPPPTPALITDPRACVLSDRYALLLAAAACLGVHQSQGQQPTARFLNDPAWAVLALSRIARRLGTAVPELPDGVIPAVIAELLHRHREHRSFDLYATQLAG